MSWFVRRHQYNSYLSLTAGERGRRLRLFSNASDYGNATPSPTPAQRNGSVVQRYLGLVDESKFRKDEKQLVLAKKLDRIGGLVSVFHEEKQKLKMLEEAKQREMVAEAEKQKEGAPAEKPSSKTAAAANNGLNDGDVRIRVPRGLYIYGNVGTGKTMLMDIFFDTLTVPKKRVHLHSFLQHIHAEIHKDRMRPKKEKRGARAAIEEIGKTLAKDNAILAFDEFFVTDAADAAILAGLIHSMMNEGIILIATSNVEPEELHESFQEYLPQLLAHCKVHDINSEVDYRSGDSEAIDVARPSHIVTDDPMQYFANILSEKWDMSLKEKVNISCGFGRAVEVPYTWIEAGKYVGASTFEYLCGSKHPVLGPNEYHAICESFDRFLIVDVPTVKIAPGRVGDESRRFGTFIDIAYDTGLQLTTVSKHDSFFVVDSESTELLSEENPELIASIRSFLRAKSRWNEMSRGPTK